MTPDWGEGTYINGTIRERHVAHPVFDVTHPVSLPRPARRGRRPQCDMTPCADCEGTKDIGYHHEATPRCVEKEKHHPFRPKGDP